MFPRIMDSLMSADYLGSLRGEALAAARGRVLELGFGTGLNARFYTAAVTELVAVDTNLGMESRARARLDGLPFPVKLEYTDGETLPYDDDSFDTAVSTYTLCTVTPIEQVLAEIRRVLKPDGQFIVLEHGLADDPGVQTWQRRLNGLNRLAACGCNLDRDIRGLVERGGFEFDSLRTFYLEQEPRPFGFTYLGAAAKRPARPAP